MKKLSLLLVFLSMTIQPSSAQEIKHLIGDWKGYINIQGNHLIIKAHFSQANSGIEGTIDIPQQGGKDLQLHKITHTDDDAVSWIQDTGGNGIAKYKGQLKTVSDITGTFSQNGAQFPFELKRYNPKSNQQVSSDNTQTKPSRISNNAVLAGDWKGTIDANVPLLIKTNFQKQNDELKGTLEIQSTKLPLQNIRVPDDDSVHFEFQSGNGLATFKGSFESDSSIAGNFLQAGYTFPFKLHRFEQDTMAKHTPLPYHHKDLIIKNDSIAIGGTLTWPENKKADQLIIMISGSGAQDRDEATPVTDFKPFAVLADSLTTDGVATFRYDDRGIGESIGNFGNATLDTLASDVKAVINYFKTDADQQFDQIILLGHSQGGVVVGKVAAESEGIDNLILMASSGLTLKKISDFQVTEAMKRAGLTKKQIEQEMAARNRLISAVKHQKNVSQAKERYADDHFKLLQSLSDSTASTEKLKKAARQETKGIVTAYSNPQFKSLLFYDPTDDLKKLHIPVLALFGGKDTQVSIALNKEPIKAALDEADVPHDIKIFRNANHLFQKAKTGEVQEYATLPNQFVEGFTSTIAQWIKK